MKKEPIRLYNEYGSSNFSADSMRFSGHINKTIKMAVDEIWENIVVKEDYCPRDVENVAINSLSAEFSERIISKAISMRKNALNK